MKKAINLNLSLAAVLMSLAATLCLAVASCSDDPPSRPAAKQPIPPLEEFTAAPVLYNLTTLVDGFRYTWKESTPRADHYDVYYVLASVDDPEALKEQAREQEPETVIENATQNSKIDIELQNNQYISLLITAKKEGYVEITSEILKAVKTNDVVYFERPGVSQGKPFTKGPVLTVVPVTEGLQCTWVASSPAADPYNLYYIEGYLEATELNVELIKEEGTEVSGVTSPHTISSLDGTKYYSVVITATLDTYADKDSLIEANKKPLIVIPSGGSLKRGVGYKFSDVADNRQAIESEIDLLRPGVHWFYDWGFTPAEIVETTAKSRRLTYFPMAFNNVTADDKESLRRLVRNNSDSNYLLAFNEPNVTEQANLTPSVARSRWADVKAIADELHIKMLTPAMNTGTMQNYTDPIKWLDDFFSTTAAPKSDVSGIAIHVYKDYPATTKAYIDQFKKYGKKIWVTEFCAKEQVPSVEWQMKYMSEICTYMELDPDIERYAWFTPRGPEITTVAPYNQLLNKTYPNTLTDLGVVYVNMGDCNKSVWVSPGQTIKAKDFTDCILSEYVSTTYPNGNLTGEGSSVHFRPGTDGNRETLDVYNFTANKWLEYQFEVPQSTQSKNYTLSLRNKTVSPVTMTITVSQNAIIKTVSLESPDWTTTPIELGDITPGKDRIRLKVTAGNCELSWLKLE